MNILDDLFLVVFFMTAFTGTLIISYLVVVIIQRWQARRSSRRSTGNRHREG
jgi:hypothetical protein